MPRLRKCGAITPETASWECFRCRIKVHQDHLDSEVDSIAPCKIRDDPNPVKALLLLAANSDDQKEWTESLGKIIRKCGYKAKSGVAPRTKQAKLIYLLPSLSTYDPV
jgi:hypothetical protein